MNISTSIKFISLLLISVVSIAPTQINTKSQKQEKQYKLPPVTILDTFVNEMQKQLEQIQSILSDLSSMINEGQVPTVVDKKETIKVIKSIISFIQGIQHEKFIHIDPQTTVFLLDLIQELIKHLSTSLDSGLKKIDPFDMEKLVTRKGPKEITLEDLENKLKGNKQSLKKLSKQADHAGLRWFNHLYRGIDKYFISPCYKYSIPLRLFEAGAVGAAGLYLIWHFLDEESFPQFLRDLKIGNMKLFGPFPSMDLSGHAREPKDIEGYSEKSQEEKEKLELGLLGKAEVRISRLTLGNLVVGGAIIGGAYKGLQHEWALIKPKIYKKLAIWTNKLKGGAYIKKAHQLDDVIKEVTFDDLVGLENVKEQFKLFVDYLENPEAFDRADLTPQKGCLLIGETRTGKTYSVNALFTEIKRMLKRNNRKDSEFKFFDLNASEINQEGIAYLLNLMKIAAPCIVFIDEIDLLDLQRRGKNQMLSEFLTCMSGTLDSKDPKNQIIIIAATNRPENLDEALRQPGRFGIELRYEYPSFAERKKFLLQKIDKLSLDPQHFDLDKLARETAGKSYEALNMLIKHSVLKARIRGQVLSQQHLEETLNEELRNIIPIDNKNIPAHEKHLLATHFAGHALALKMLNISTRLSEVTIRRVKTTIREEWMGSHLVHNEDDNKKKRYEYGEIFVHHEFDTINMYTRNEKINLIKYHLSGIAAEEILLGSASFSCHHDDMNRALAIAQSIVFEGIDISKLPSKMKTERYEKAMELIEQCKQEMQQLMYEHKDKLITIVDTLQKKEILSGEDVQNLLDGDLSKKELVASAA